MRLKIFIFPLLIIVIFFLGFNYIKPDIDSILQQRKAMELSRQKIADIESKISNVEAIAASMASGGKDSAKVDFLNSYLPETIDEERLADQLNYVAVTSGVILNSVAFEKAKPIRKAPQRAALEEEMGDEEGGMEPPSFHEPDTVEARVNILATYDGLRQFASGVDKLKQLNTISSVRIERVDEQSDDGGAPVPTDLLNIELAVDFYALSRKSLPQAYLLPVFDGTSYDFAGYADIPASDGYVPIVPPTPGHEDIFHW